MSVMCRLLWVTFFSPLVFAASLAILCGLTHSSVDCREERATFIECDVQVIVGSYRQRGSLSYLYVCEDSPPHWDINPPRRHFAGLFARLVLRLSNS